jgi:hypothetical protein
LFRFAYLQHIRKFRLPGRLQIQLAVLDEHLEIERELVRLVRSHVGFQDLRIATARFSDTI